MQYAKTLLSVSLIFGSVHVQAETQSSVKENNAMVVAPSQETQMAHTYDTSAAAQQKNAKAPAARLQPKPNPQNRPYEIPLGDYNNGGHFGN